MNSVITIISDYGLGSPYAAAFMGMGLQLLPDAKIIEISHQINPFDLVQTAFLLKSVYRNFPAGTCHLIGVDANINLHKQVIWITHEGQHFIGADNGIFSLLFDEPIQEIFKVNEDLLSKNDLFPEKNFFLPLIARFLQEGSVNSFAKPANFAKELQSMNAVWDDYSLGGAVMYVDAYQNAITNIKKDVFNQASKGRPFKLYYWSKHYIDKISKHFNDEEAGEDLLLYNENDYLIISMNRGKGAQLLGLKPGSKIIINFEDTLN